MEFQAEKNLLRQRRFIKIEAAKYPNDSLEPIKKEERKFLPFKLGLFVLFVIAMLFKLGMILENSLPSQLTLSESDCDNTRFNGKKAELVLKRITDLGPRVVGSYENEVLTVDLLKREILFIQQEAYVGHSFEIDVQTQSGSYLLNMSQYGFVNSYSNIQNIAVKLSTEMTKTPRIPNSIVVNCHYDTVPESPGASDNGLNCAVMLEVLRVLSTSKKGLRNSVIFLFNGAEENPLQGSHAFLNSRKWSDVINLVINLDAGGAGGKELLFRFSGTHSMLDAYSKTAKHPSASVLADEIFSLIPSETDFKVFTEVGHYLGFDFAHFSNGYVYHTKHDKMDYIPSGTYQHTGDNILALVEYFSQMDLPGFPEEEKFIYFDIFGIFYFYSEAHAFYINLFLTSLSLVILVYIIRISPYSFSDLLNSLFIAGLGLLLGMICTFFYTQFIFRLLDYTKSTMSWYSRPWLIVPLYFIPNLCVTTGVMDTTKTVLKKIKNPLFVFMMLSQLHMTICLPFLTFMGLRSSFIPMINIFFASAGNFAFAVQNTRSDFGAKFCYFNLVSLIFSTAFVLRQSYRVFLALLPVMGRIGPGINPEMIICVLSSIISTYFVSYLAPLFVAVRKCKTLLVSLFCIHLFVLMGVIYTDLGFPYSGDPQNLALQRFYVFHSDRKFYDAEGNLRKSDSGIFIQSLDRNNINYVQNYLPLAHSQNISEDCDTEMFCGFPMFTPRSMMIIPYSYWIPCVTPTVFRPTTMEVVNRTHLSPTAQKIYFSVTGANHITIGLSPEKSVKLQAWSFKPKIPNETYTWKNRSVYVIYHSFGVMAGNLEFDIEVQSSKPNDTVLDITVIGHYLHDKKYRTSEFEQIISRFPSWAHVTPWTTTYSTWKI